MVLVEDGIQGVFYADFSLPTKSSVVARGRANHLETPVGSINFLQTIKSKQTLPQGLALLGVLREISVGINHSGD